MRHRCPKSFQDRVTRVGGLNRYGGPNYRLAWSQDETFRAGGIWPEEHFIGYRTVYLATCSPEPPSDGYWMLLDWQGPEEFGGEAMWDFLHRDERTGLNSLGPYPHRGRYQIAAKLIWSWFDNGKLIIEGWPLDSRTIDMVIPVIRRHKNDSSEQKRRAANQMREEAERQKTRKIEALIKDSKRSLLPSQIDDRIRLMEKQWAKFLKHPTMRPGFQQA